MKPLESAATGMRVLDDGRLELTIHHDIVRGVTPAMLAWWFHHIDGTMEYEGQTYPRYLVWHPGDHIHYAVERRAADGSAGAGARFHIVEALGRDLNLVIDGAPDVPQNDETGLTLSLRKLGVEVMRLHHAFTSVPGGAQYDSQMLVGVANGPCRRLLNAWIRRRLFPPDKARAWLKHNVEEVGNFEFFLPNLYAAETPAT